MKDLDLFIQDLFDHTQNNEYKTFLLFKKINRNIQ